MVNVSLWDLSSGVFRILVRRGQGAVGIDGLECGGGDWAKHPQKKIIFVVK